MKMMTAELRKLK